MIADKQLTRIIDKSQNAMYAEKVDVIWDTLNRAENRLQKTGLVEAYADDFKESTVEELRKAYYKHPNQVIYPFILDGDFKVVIHPVLPAGDLSLLQLKEAKRLLSSERGDFSSTDKDQATWYAHRLFDPWNWGVVYVVPLDVKYADAYALRDMLVVVMVAITFFVLAALAVILKRFTKPIVNLTEISTQIAGGNLEQRIDLSAKDEIGTLSRSFDNMRKAVKQQIIDLNREIDERKLAEEELRHLRNYLTNIIDSMPSVLVGVDIDGRVTLWNKTAEQTTGITADAAQGKIISDVFPWMVSDMERITKSIRTREIKQRRKMPRLLENSTCYEDMTIYPLITNGVEGAVIRVDDVTDKVRMEEMMIQSEKMLSVGGLAAGMAHEINNPIAGMMQTASVMANRLSENINMPANLKAAEAAGTTMEAIRYFMEARSILRMITAIVDSGRRVAAIVDNMLSFARKSDAQISSHLLSELLDKTLELAAADYDLQKRYDFKKIEIKKEYDDKGSFVPCEGAKIQQVLLNIFRNGGQAMLDARIKDPKFIVRTRFERQRERVCIEIEDNGPGMDEATRKRVFEPFFTTKPVGMGTGLGLSVSYFIITENHGGEMAVESRPGSGAKFIIRLPLEGRREG
ncbi:MAG: HAMP domain-containing protein [Desulfobacterium sp.]|nr:HAMP domain-containing protein [Desulfobacterium sp.]